MEWYNNSPFLHNNNSDNNNNGKYIYALRKNEISFIQDDLSTFPCEKMGPGAIIRNISLALLMVYVIEKELYWDKPSEIKVGAFFDTRNTHGKYFMGREGKYE